MNCLAIIGEEGKVDVDKIVAAAKGGVAARAKVRSRRAKNRQPSNVKASRSCKATTASEAGNQQSTELLPMGELRLRHWQKNWQQKKELISTSYHGTGDGGRIVKADIDSYNPAAATAPAEKKAATLIYSCCIQDRKLIQTFQIHK